MNEHSTRLHTELCTSCSKLKQTGLTLGLHEEWRTKFSRRPAIERAMRTLNKGYDESLLQDKVCTQCKDREAAEAYAAEHDLDITEHVTLETEGNDDE